MNRFLFGPYPLTLQNIDQVFFYASAAAVGIAIVLFLIHFFAKLNPVNERLSRRVRNFLLSFGLLGLVWSWFRYENATYLMWRFWFVIIVLSHLVWLVKILWYVIKDYRPELEAFKHQQLKEKYLK